MAVVGLTLYTATNSFGLISSQDMIAKAWREYERAKHAKSSDDRRDAVLNCSITAWYLTDWIWTSITQNDRHDQSLIQLFGATGSKPVRKDFIDWVLRTCPEMEICQSICNGTKHVTCGTPLRTALGQPVNPNSVAQKAIPRATITTNGGDVDALDVLGRVIDFWWEQGTRGPVFM